MRQLLLCSAAIGALILSSCTAMAPPAADTTTTPAATAAATPKQTPAEFLAAAEKELSDFSDYAARVAWVNSTYITDDTDWLNSRAGSEGTLLSVRLANATKQFEGAQMTPEQKRKMDILRAGIVMPAPSKGTPDQQKAIADELATITTNLQSTYGKGKVPLDPAKFDVAAVLKILNASRNKEEPRDPKAPLTLEEASLLLSESRDPKILAAAWEGWHAISPAMKPDYQRMVEIGNEGARELGFKDVADMWLANYDMPSADMEKTVERLWTQVKPLYDDLHCYVRGRLSKKYGVDKVPATGPIPAHLLGNMWAQEWANVYPLVEPYAGQPSLDVTRKLQAKKYDPVKLVQLGERFFTSLGMDPLPKTFWERSQFVKPAGRDVVCHASAWDVTFSNDLRIKMCIKIDQEDLVTVHHELGHNYYFMNYFTKPVLFQQGANDGFHEAIGDALTLSITPEYLKQLGLIDALPKDEKGLINVQMKDALEKVAFLPFGRMIDQWRWDVFSGKVKPEQYNAHWWALRQKYQGIAAAGGERGEQYFDPGAKYHIPANVPYMRYFLARILQFQFHRAMCQAAGHQGPLHTCSIYDNKVAGAKLKAMLELGASKPWPDALEALTGQRQMDATAILDYFQPLQAWLKAQNQGQQCGW